MKSLKNIFLLLLLALVPCSSMGKTSSKAKSRDAVTLVTFGEGATRDEAVSSALRSAIEQTYGVFVSSNTDILNDVVVRDEIISVAKGNINGYDILSESMMDGRWSVSANVSVSPKKLVSYVSSKGGSVELSGEMFQKNVSLWKMKMQNEKVAIEHLRKKIMQTYFIVDYYDYSISVGEPRYVAIGNKYEMQYSVRATPNENLFNLYTEIESTLRALSCYETPPAGFEVYGDYRLRNDYWWNDTYNRNRSSDNNPWFAANRVAFPEVAKVVLSSSGATPVKIFETGLSSNSSYGYSPFVGKDKYPGSPDSKAFIRDGRKCVNDKTFSASGTIVLSEEEFLKVKKVDVFAYKKFSEICMDEDVIPNVRESEAEALAKLAVAYLDGAEGYTQNQALGHTYMYHAARKGDPNALYYMGTFYNKLYGQDSALEFWTKAAELGHEYAAYLMGKISRDKGERIKYWEKIADKRDMGESFNYELATLYREQGSHSSAATYYEKLAMNGGKHQGEAEYWLGLYYYGLRKYNVGTWKKPKYKYLKISYEGIKKDKSKGAKWLAKAVSHGYIKVNPTSQIVTTDELRGEMRKDGTCGVCGWRTPFVRWVTDVNGTREVYGVHESCLQEYLRR